MNRKERESEKFVFLDDNHQTLASAVLLGQQGQTKTFQLTYAPDCNLQDMPALNALSVNSPEFMAWRGHILQIRDDKIDFLAEERIDSHLRRHLRIAMPFRTYLYPPSGHETRLPVISKDISCGGIALYSVTRLKKGQKFQIALPCTEPPLIVRVEVLRLISDLKNLYALQFDDLLPQEEAMIQECIFEYDLHHHSA